MTKAAARSPDLTIKKDGKPFAKWSYTVADDGQTMTEVGGATTNEIKIVYHRQ